MESTNYMKIDNRTTITNTTSIEYKLTTNSGNNDTNRNYCHHYLYY